MKTKTELEKMRSDVARGNLHFVVAIEQSVLGVITLTSYIAGEQRIYERLTLKPLGEFQGTEIFSYDTKKRVMGRRKAEWSHMFARALLLT